MKPSVRWLLLMVVPLAMYGTLLSCSSAPKETKPAPAPPAKVDNRVKESDLTRVTLSPEAEQRLGIELATVTERTASNQLAVSGEIVPIPGKTLIVTAPASGTVALARKDMGAGQIVKSGEAVFRLTPMLPAQRDLKITYEADVLSAKARLDAATQQLERSKQLLRDMAGSKRNVEAADQEYGQAKAVHDASQLRLKRLETHPLDADVEMTITAPSDGILRQIQVAEGQNVASGAPLFEVADFSRVWLRVPVYSADLKLIARAETVDVRDIDGTGRARQARRVAAPPTADALAVTADLYYEIANADLHLRPGQRLAVVLPLQGHARKGFSAPLSAVLYDIYGGTWVYVNEAPRVYRRQRVELIETAGQSALLSRGVSTGAKVVVQGAAELFGTEFGAGH